MKPINQIERIRQKVQGLLRKQANLEKENGKLHAELDRKTALEAELRQKVGQLEEKVNVVKLSSGEMDDAARKAFEKQLNQYIREIDRCIAMLSE